jgi:hypothetical protein
LSAASDARLLILSQEFDWVKNTSLSDLFLWVAKFDLLAYKLLLLRNTQAVIYNNLFMKEYLYIPDILLSNSNKKTPELCISQHIFLAPVNSIRIMSPVPKQRTALQSLTKFIFFQQEK